MLNALCIIAICYTTLHLYLSIWAGHIITHCLSMSYMLLVLFICNVVFHARVLFLFCFHFWPFGLIILTRGRGHYLDNSFCVCQGVEPSDLG